LNIDNSDSDDEMIFDVRVMSWTGVDAAGANILSPTEAVISSRPVITVPAHKRATVRFLTTARTTTAQDNFRVLLKDITPIKNGDDMSPRMTTSLPLIVVNDATAKAVLEVGVDGSVTNIGGRHARITSYKDRSGKTISALRYILPGQSAALGVAHLDDIKFNDSLY
jgi:fimbrial chaperone protein